MITHVDAVILAVCDGQEQLWEEDVLDRTFGRLTQSVPRKQIKRALDNMTKGSYCYLTKVLKRGRRRGDPSLYVYNANVRGLEALEAFEATIVRKGRYSVVVDRDGSGAEEGK